MSPILRIAVPSIISNITVPLLGLIDVAIVGHLGAASYIGAIAVGGMMFNVIYWIFGFLRMGTSGMTSQALGARRLDETVRMLARSTTIAVGIAMLLIVMQYPIREAALMFMNPTDEVRRFSSTYYNICIWGAPAMLGLFAMSGWSIGMQNSRIPMAVAIVQNVVNIIASLLFVFVFGLKVEGVAFGTLTAQYAGFIVSAVLVLSRYRRLLSRYFSFSGIWQRDAMISFFKVNRDIFLRTVCLVSVMMFFTSAGSWQGEVILAVNTMLMQMYMLFSYIMDGFAYAGEALSGKYYGARDTAMLQRTVRHLFIWGAVMTVFFTAAYAVGGDAFLSLLTDDRDVVNASADYFLWALALPVAGVAAFIWDGVFIGCTFTRGMLISMFAASVVFFALYYSLRDVYGNHALWLAFIAYLSVRGIAQTGLFKSYKIG
ncbi:MATE family efflux transporter [Xylanibacter caecicola]|uniref:MATE family efflux transporter n=1 Tax=Xylanibacter caecicola TaxID=2736294 RepID=UPI00258C518B|nr:MATE family efflux transporter [Xylanibacter caecicola]